MGQLSEVEQISEAEYRAGTSVFESAVVKQPESRRQGGNRERPQRPRRVKGLKAGKGGRRIRLLYICCSYHGKSAA
ncbi:hypothetical protein DWW99_13685 [[Clostridium] leptum]|nr:hypothetical protein DWW99_13685 [[Clostridium] leptum]